MKKSEPVPDLEKYYYFRDDNNQPRVTVCLLKFGKDVYKGISICSKKDNVDKQYGRWLAFCQALRARENRPSHSIDRTEALEVLESCNAVDQVGMLKSYKNPELSSFEEKLLAH